MSSEPNPSSLGLADLVVGGHIEPVDRPWAYPIRAALVIVPAAFIWGAIYWTFGEPLTAAVPWGYLVIASASIGVFAITRNYAWFAVSQFTCIWV